MPTQPSKFITWTPRILSIVFLLFMGLMSLDVFDENVGFWGTILGLFMHNIPALVLLGILIIAWKREIVGGVGFIVAGLLYSGLVIKEMVSTGFEWYYLTWMIQISGIAFFIGALFLVGWSKKKNR